MTQKLQNFLSQIDSSDIESRNEKIIQLINKEQQILKSLVRNSLDKIINIRKSRTKGSQYEQFKESTKRLETALLNILNVHIILLKDNEYTEILTISQIEQRIGQLKKCINRTVDTYNRMTSNTKRKLLATGKEKGKKIHKQSKNCKIDLENTVELQKWLISNFQNPYPTVEERTKLAKDSELSENQVNNWFINARQRILKKLAKRDPKQYQKPNYKYGQSIDAEQSAGQKQDQSNNSS